MKKILNNSFFKGSLIMLLGSNIYNLGQFIYHFLAGRFLGKALYGDLASLISILGIVGIIQMALGLTIVKYLSSNKQQEVLTNFIKWVYRWSIWVAVIASIFSLLFSPLLASFLKLSQPLSVYLLSPLLFFLIITTSGRSILQGLIKFNSYVISLIAESIVKIGLTLIFVFLGYTLFGVVFALLLGVIVSFFVVRYAIANYLKGALGKRPDIKPLFKYSLFVFIQGLALTSMYSIDLLLVKHFFPPEEAGVYASLAILGRIIFFGSSPITQVMFPIIARRHHLGESYTKIFYLSLLIVSSFSLILIAFYYFFPRLAIGLLYGPAYLIGSSLLWWFALFMGLLSLAMLMTQFYLSIGKTKIISLFGVAAVLQIILIWFIHPSLLSVVQLSILSAALLDLCLIVYFVYAFGNRSSLQAGKNY